MPQIVRLNRVKVLEVKRILVSQPAPAIAAKAPFYDIATKYGVEIDYHPFVKIEGVDLREFRSQRIEVLKHSAIIFLNRSTVDSFFQVCEQARINIPITMKYFCSTEAIALYLQKYIQYRKRKIFFATGQFDSLCELILKHPSEKYLLTMTEPSSSEVVTTLDYLCVDYHKAIFAKSVSVDLSDVDIEKYDLVALYSTPEITTLMSAFEGKRLPAIAAFGNRTAAAVSSAELHLATTAPTPGVPSLAKAVEILIAHLKEGGEMPSLSVQAGVAEEFIRARTLKPIRRPRTVVKAGARGSSARGGSKLATRQAPARTPQAK